MVRRTRAGAALAVLLLAPMGVDAKPSLGPRARAAGALLEAQLACRANPDPARVARSLAARGLLKRTPYDHDGSPVWAPAAPMMVFGVPVRFITGWQADDNDEPLKPFTRGPGTMPPRFLAVTVTRRPAPGVFPPTNAAGPDGPHAAVNDTGADLKPGVELVCYGG